LARLTEARRVEQEVVALVAAAVEFDTAVATRKQRTREVDSPTAGAMTTAAERVVVVMMRAASAATREKREPGLTRLDEVKEGFGASARDKFTEIEHCLLPSFS
jgi:hypothetical protein